MDAIAYIREIGVLPVIKIEKVEYAKPLAEALRKGGINALEVTFRNESAHESLRVIKEAFPDMVVGAGTILTTELAQKARSAGADYVVMPGYNTKTVEFCLEQGIPVIPGCVTPAEIETAIEAGFDTLKFFPAETNGGVTALKALSGPYPQVRFVPTGGIDFHNLGSYLRLNCVAACGGSFMAKTDLIREEQWDQITRGCRRAMDISLGFELAHVGINNASKEEAVANAEAMNRIFSLGVKVGSGKSSFLGTAAEFMHAPYYGNKGHIAFKTNSPLRAKAYFERNGIKIREESITYSEGGELRFFYLEKEIGGFALHIVKNSE